MKHHKRLLLKLLQVDRVGPVFIYRALSAISGISDQAEMIAHFSRNHEALSEALERVCREGELFFVQYGVCSGPVARAFRQALEAVSLDQELDDIQKTGAFVDTCFDVEYPELLRHIHAPPAVLYRMGQPIDVNRPALAVVGSREATAYGLSCVEAFVPTLAAAGVNLVSGGAVGIDAAVHKKSIENGGITTVVLGSGLLHMYPYANKPLFAHVLERGGTIFSPFSMAQRPERGTFPARNRIIAGLAQACLVVEASAKSGALITAGYALDANRTVCAVPGSIFSPTSEGCHDLLRRGAVLVSCVEDILRELGCEGSQEVALATNVEKTMTARGELSKENEFFVFLSKGPRSDEEVAIFLGKSLSETQDFLFDLQLEGKIKQQFTGLWGLSGS